MSENVKHFVSGHPTFFPGLDPSLVAFKSKRVVLPDKVVPAIVLVEQGRISKILNYDASLDESFADKQNPIVTVVDVGNLVIMAGLVDSHVHVNDPGRTHWEGYQTATRAAAAGGVTTIVDMPLNSLPPTTTLNNLETKIKTATGQIMVDVALWGGIIPGNQKELIPMLNAGVRGFKCFMCHSGVDEFPQVTQMDIETALAELQNSRAQVLFHAEVQSCDIKADGNGSPCQYSCFLGTRPGVMEVEAIRLVISLCDRYRVPCHIVHLSSAEALSMIQEAKSKGIPLTVETCPHYLTLTSEDVPDKATQYKCCPPIRNKPNQDQLWEGISKKIIDAVVSDHSPAPADLKCRETGDFLAAWGGISSLQLVLPLLWTFGSPKGLDLLDMTRLMSQNTARLACLHKRKGFIAEGMDADFVIWNPDETFTVTEEVLHFRHKLSPYLGKVLKGRIVMTVLRGNPIFSNEHFTVEPNGQLLLDD